MKKRFGLVLVAAVVLLGVLGGGAYFALANKQSAPEMYQDAIGHSVSVETDKLYATFDVNSDSIKFSGEAAGDISGDDLRMKADLKVNTESEGVPVTFDVEMIALTKEKKDEVYARFTSVSSPDEFANEGLKAYFEPVINKWGQTIDDQPEDTSLSFEEDGALAAFNVIGLFAPTTSLNETDKQTFLNLVEKYELYQVSDDIETTRFKGVESRKLSVNVTKDAFVEFEREADQKLSDDAEFEKWDTKFTNQLFGDSEKIGANVYLDPSENKIIGVDFSVDLDNPVVDQTFGTELEELTASFLIDYDRTANIEAPKSYVKQEEIDALLN